MIINNNVYKCLENLQTKLNNKEKHINVFSPFVLPPDFIKELIEFLLKHYKTVMVAYDEEIAELYDIVLKNGITVSTAKSCKSIKRSDLFSAFIYSTDSLLDTSSEDISFEALILLSPKLLLRDCFKTTISPENVVITLSDNFKFNNYCMDIEYNKEAAINRQLFQAIDSVTSKTNSEVIITCPGRIFDIRDICGASAEEQRKLFPHVSDCFYSLSEITYSCNSNSKETKSDQDIIAELKRENEKLRDLVKFLRQLLAVIGVSRCDIDKAFEEVTEAKRKLQENIQLLGTNEEAIEQETACFENMVSEKIIKLIEPLAMEYKNRNYYEGLLLGYLGEDVWYKKLCNESRKLLITSRMTFDSMWQMDDRKRLDFTGICMMLSKTLDIELSRRFYDKYTAWLTNKGIDIINWPEALVFINRHYNTYQKINQQSFTLGSINHLFGKKAILADFEQTIDFASKNLYSNNLSKNEVADKLRDVADWTNKIREDYRNPAAHRTEIHDVDAKSCMEYMISFHRKLRLILESMSV